MKDGEASNPLFNVRKRNEGAKKGQGRERGAAVGQRGRWTET